MARMVTEDELNVVTEETARSCGILERRIRENQESMAGNLAALSADVKTLSAQVRQLQADNEGLLALNLEMEARLQRCEAKVRSS